MLPKDCEHHLMWVYTIQMTLDKTTYFCKKKKKIKSKSTSQCYVRLWLYLQFHVQNGNKCSLHSHWTFKYFNLYSWKDSSLEKIHLKLSVSPKLLLSIHLQAGCFNTNCSKVAYQYWLVLLSFYTELVLSILQYQQ